MTVCTGRPLPGAECVDSRAYAPNLLGALFAQLSARAAALRDMASAVTPTGLPTAAPLAPVSLGKQAHTAVRTADKYMQARLAGRNADVLRLVADDVRLTSSRDGVVHGKKHFANYLQRVKAIGVWNAAQWDQTKQRAEVRGIVKVLFVNVNVVAHFGLDRRGKISDIYIGKSNGTINTKTNRSSSKQ